MKRNAIPSEIRGAERVTASSVFTKNFAKLFVPLMLQSVLEALINATDSFMLGRLSQEAMSAIVLACQVSQIAISYFSALCVGCTALIAQYYGNSDLDSVKKVSVISLQFSVGGGLLFFLISLLIPESVMRLFTNDAELIPLGVSYLRIVAVSFLFTSVSRIYLDIMKNTGNARIGAVFGSVPVVINIVLNYLLIFGKFGFPALGVKGAAIGTTVSKGVELVLVIAYVSRSKTLRNASVRDYFRLYRGLMRKFIRYTTPSVVHVCMWNVANSLLVAVLGHMGSDIVSASSVAITLYTIAYSFGCGSYSTAVGITLGHMLGKGEVQRAKRTGDVFLTASAVFGAVLCVMTALLGPFVIPLYNTLSDQAVGYLRIMIFIISFKLIFKLFNYTLSCGIFTSGGDIAYVSKLDIIVMWLVILPASAIAAFALRLDPMVVYVIVNLDETVKIYHMISHYRKYLWAKNLTRKEWAPPGSYDRRIREKIIDDMPLGVMIVSNAGRIVLTNDACARLLGMEREEIEGGNYRSLFLAGDESREALSNLLLDAVADKATPRETDMRYAAPNGERLLHIRASYMEDEDCRIGLCLMISEAGQAPERVV